MGQYVNAATVRNVSKEVERARGRAWALKILVSERIS
jgi:hypothetical protein